MKKYIDFSDFVSIYEDWCWEFLKYTEESLNKRNLL